MAWTLAGSVGSRIVALAGTLILTHFIAPGVDGEVGIAVVLMQTLAQLSNFAFGNYLLARKDSNRELNFHATLYHFVLGLLAAGALMLLRHPVARFYDAPRVAHYVPGFALTLILERIGYVPERLLIHEMRFRSVALTRSVSEVAFSVAAVACAAGGMGGDSIVAGNIFRSTIRAIVFVMIVDRAEWLTPCRLSTEHRRALFSFGLPLWLANVTHFASRTWDNLLYAALFGPGPSALYAKAYNLADVPATQIGESVGDVLVPSFTRMEGADRGAGLIRWTALLGLIVFPLAVGLGAVAPPLVRALFNDQWQGVAPLLMILSVLSVVRPISWTVGSYLQAQGRTRTIMVLEVSKTILLFASMVLLGRLGPTWACVGVGLAFTANTIGCLWAVHHQDGVSAHAFLSAMWRPLVACVPMVVVIAGLHYAFRALGIQRAVVEVVVGIVLGALAYVPSAFLIATDTARDAVRLAKDAVRERGARRGPQGAGAG